MFEGQRLTYAQLDAMSQTAGESLLAAGIQRGERVAIMLANVPAFVVWYYGALRVGAIAVSISTRLAKSEVAFVVSDCGARIFVSDSATHQALADELPDCVVKSISVDDWGNECGEPLLARQTSAPSTWLDAEPDDAAVILYTSGTTGFAKGATLSHLNVRSNVHAFNHLCQMRTRDRILLAVPLFHCFGQNALLNAAFNVGATLVLQRKFDLSEAKQLIRDEQVTQLFGVPMMFQLFYESCDRSDLKTIRYCFSAAATLPVQTSRRWQEKFGMPIYEGYGLTETSPFASYNHRNKFVRDSIGTPIDCVEMKIVDTDTGTACPPGELGEIAIRGPNVMLRYWNRPDDTAAAIRDGWFHSGDIGRMDDDGFFYIVDRVKDMIAVGGLKVYPAEVERVLLDCPAVSQVAVAGIPHKTFGEQVVAFVVLKTNQQASYDVATAAIKQHAKEKLANYKVPQAVIVIDELPRNPSGKVLKTKLREMSPNWLLDADTASPVAAAAPAPKHGPSKLRQALDATHATSRPGVAVTFLQRLVQTVAGSDELPDPEARFIDAGLDSLMIVEMSSQIQAEVGPQIEISSTLVFDHPRICDLAQFLVDVLQPTELKTPPIETKSNLVSTPSADLESEIATMSEQQALEELMKELET